LGWLKIRRMPAQPSHWPLIGACAHGTNNKVVESTAAHAHDL